MTEESLSHCPLCRSTRRTVLDESCGIHRCLECGLQYDNPRPDFESLARFYSQPGKYDGWLAQGPEREALWKRRLRKIRPMICSGSLLDVGAGIGQFLNLARESFSPVSGTEVSAAAIGLAREKYQISLHAGTIDTLPVNGPQFDLITVFHVLEHVPDPGETLRKCHSLLRPGGCLVVAVPNEISSLRSITKRILFFLTGGRTRRWGRLGLPKIALDGSQEEIHLSHFTTRSLEYGFRQAGFSVIQDSLDPYFVDRGMGLIIHQVWYQAALCIRGFSGLNPYPALWMAGRKPEPTASGR